MGDFGECYVDAEIAGLGLRLSRFSRRCLQPAGNGKIKVLCDLAVKSPG
jgi:hypothetical protein